MAGKVNTKFVVILSVVMVLLFGAALGLTFWIKGRSSEDLIKQGDAKMAAKDFAGAERAYSKAVNKEQTNVAYFEKWLSSLEAWAPETQTEYVGQYQKYVGVKRNIARLKITDIKSHREFLDLMYIPFTQERFSSAAADQVIAEVERTLGLMRSSKADTGGVRRYRGLVRVRMMNEPGVDLPTEKRDEAKADLEAGLVADPNDGACAVGLMNWYLYQAEGLRRANKESEAEPMESAGRKLFTEYCAAHPDNPTAAAAKLLIDLTDAQRSTKDEADFRARFDATRVAFDALKPRLEALNAVFTSASPATLDVGLMGQFRVCEEYIDPSAKGSRSAALLSRGLAAQPDEAGLMLMNGQILAARENIDAALAQLQKIVDMPKKPVGPAGIRLFTAKSEALYTQAGYIFQKWEMTKGETERAALVEQAKKLRPVMALSMSEDAMPILYVDAMSAFASGDMLGSRQLLNKFNEVTNKSNVSTLWAQAQAELRLNNLGTGRALLEQVVTRRGDLPAPHVLLAKIEYQLRETPQALKRLDMVLKADPNFEPAKELLQQIKIATGTEKPTDKVTQVLTATDRMLGGESDLPDVPGAVALLSDAIKETPDARLFLALASLQSQLEDKAAAIATVQAGLKASPDNADLKLALEGLNQADPVKWQLGRVDSASIPEVDKQLQKGRILANAGRLEESAAAFAAAAKAAPEDPRVIDQQFLMALRQKNYDLASKIVENAKAKNLDRANGRLYEARLLATQGRNAEAALALEAAEKAGAADSGSLRLLGRTYTILGRFGDADRAFREALAQRPDDVATMVDQVSAMVQAGQGSEALERARQYVKVARRNRAFEEQLLGLEAKYGERDLTIKRREAMMTREPSNMVNKLELARLYAEGRRWNDAEALASQIKPGDLDLDVASLRARIKADQGDIAAAQGVMDDYIKSLDPKAITIQPFMLFGQVLADRRLYTESVAMFERGRPYQTPTVMEIERSVGDMLSNIGRADLAIPYYERILEAKADGPNQEVRLRLVEMLANLQKWDDAAKYIEGVVVGGRGDPIIPLLRADVAAGKGDDRRARELYDRAITEFAQDPSVYFRRAQYFLRKNPPQTNEALQDLDASIKVRPGFWQARRTRALVYITLGRRDEAIADLREAVRSNPALDDMRLSLMRELIGLERSSQAAEMADEAMKIRPNDANLAVALSGVFVAAQDWPRSQQYAAIAWKLNKSTDIGQAYLDALLNAEPKNTTEAEKVLREPALSESIAGSSGLLVARAKVLAFKGRAGDAVKDLAASMSVVPLKPPTAVQSWWQDVRRVLVKEDEAIRFLEKTEIPPRFRDWAAFLRASMYADNPKSRLGSAAAFEEITKNAKDEGILLFAYRAWGTVLYQENKHEEAAAIWKSALGKTPDDPELLNNLAYVMARQLGNPKEALEIAQRAAAAAPNSSDALDTLGYCLMANGQLEQADSTYKNALAVARTMGQRMAVTMHLAELCVKRKDATKGKVYLDAADEMLRKNPAFSEAYKTEIAEARKQIDSLGGR